MSLRGCSLVRRGHTFIARVDPLRQQQAAELALGTLLLLHLDQVGRHAEGLVANLILVVLPNAVERGVRRVCVWRVGQGSQP